MAVQTFRYEAINVDGTLQKGTLDGESADAVAASLGGRKLIPVSVQLTGQGMQRELSLPGLGGRTRLRDLAVLTRQFASMSAAGLPLMRTLAILEGQSSRPKLTVALGEVRADVQGGLSLSAAMAQHPEHFPPLMTNTIAAGEAGGFLDKALDRVASMYESDAALRARIKSALTYPVVVLVFSCLMMIGVIWFIVPIFERMFTSLGGQLPLPTRVMVQLSHNLWWWLPLVVLVLTGSRRLYRSAKRASPRLLLWHDRMRLRLPIFGPLTTKMAVSRWARNLGTLLSVGVPVSQALEMVGTTAGNAVIANAMVDVRDSVRSGSTISQPLARHPIFPPMVVQMLEVGEESGQTSAMLDKAADFYDEEVKNVTDSLTSSLEPLLVVIIGAVIGAMVVCLYLPMFSIYQQIQTN